MLLTAFTHQYRKLACDDKFINTVNFSTFVASVNIGFTGDTFIYF